MSSSSKTLRRIICGSSGIVQGVRVEVEPRGYAAAGLEASLHNLLTRARLWRVLTHCTWEKTTVAISKSGPNVGWFVSGATCC